MNTQMLQAEENLWETYNLQKYCGNDKRSVGDEQIPYKGLTIGEG